MADREYPRWAHAEGRKSIVVETPEDEAAFLAAAPKPEAFLSQASPAPPATPVVPQRYSLVSFEGHHDGTIGGFNEQTDPSGKWVRWNDVAALFGGNLLTNDATPATTATKASSAPLASPEKVTLKRTGGWPKGKPRASRQASVN